MALKPQQAVLTHVSGRAPSLWEGWGGLLYHHEKEHLDRNNPLRCHCPHRPSGHGRHAELRNDIEKSELKKNKDLKTKRREPDVSRALFFLLYILSFSQIFVSSQAE